MKLSEIKSKKDDYVTKYVLKEMELIKKHFCFRKNTRLFYLGYYNHREYFLHNNYVFITAWNAERKNDEIDVNTLYFTEFYSVKMLNNFPKTINDVEFAEITDSIDHKVEYYPKYTVEDFLVWITQPCNLTDEVDVPYYKIVDFLNNYNVTDFKQGDYQFYTKRDKDFSWTSNIYVKNIKTNTQVKLYFPVKCIRDEDEAWIVVPPDNPKDIVLDDLSGKLNNYQKLKIKKAYLEFSKKFNEDLQSKNNYVLELLKQAIQPVEMHCGMGLHRIFAGRDEEYKPKKFTNIWVNDFPYKNEEPAFFLTDSPFFQITTKIAFLNFKSATYHTKGIYKQGDYKRNHWHLDKEYLKELIEFLKAPINRKDYPRNENYHRYVNTNWQHLIFEYNHNSAGWGWGENKLDVPPEKDDSRLSDIEALPFDLPIPDYTKLAED